MKWFNDAKKYAWYLLGMLVFWTFVPAFAKLGQFDGIQKTFWINWFAVFTIAILIPLVGRSKTRKKYTPMSMADAVKIGAFGLLFPLIYSVAYFQAIYLGSPALTTMITRASLIVYTFIVVYVLKNKTGLTTKDKVMFLITILSVSVALGNKVGSVQNIGITVFLAAIAATISGVYSAVSEMWKKKNLDPITTMFVLELVTAVAITPFALRGNFEFPNIQTLFYFFAIGALANGVAFWLQLEGWQIATSLNDSSHKVIFLIVQAGVITLTQTIMLAITGAEQITAWVWTAILMLVAGLIWYRLPEKSLNKS